MQHFTEDDIRRALDGTWTKVYPCGRVRTSRVVDIRRPLGKKPPVGHVGKGGLRTAWSREEDDTLLSMRETGRDYAAIAAYLGRTPGAVHNRLYKLYGGRS